MAESLDWVGGSPMSRLTPVFISGLLLGAPDDHLTSCTSRFSLDSDSCASPSSNSQIFAHIHGIVTHTNTYTDVRVISVGKWPSELCDLNLGGRESK